MCIRDRYGKGISREGSLLDTGVEMDIVTKSGAWYTYEGEQLGQGRENAKSFLSDNPEIMMEIENKIWAIVNPDDEQDSFTSADDEPISIED